MIRDTRLLFYGCVDPVTCTAVKGHSEARSDTPTALSFGDQLLTAAELGLGLHVVES